jgi:hypothetical protein
MIDQITLDQCAAYALGYYHALYEGYTPNNPFMDRYYAHYKRGYDAGISEYCAIVHPEEINA